MTDKKVEAHEHMNNARRYYINNNKNQAIEELRKATSIYKKLYEHEPQTLAEYYAKLANILGEKLGKYQDSARYSKKSAEKYLEAGNTEEAAYQYYVLGLTCDLDLDNLRDSADAINKAVELYLGVDENSMKAAECFTKLADIYYKLNEHDIVEHALKKSCDIRSHVAPNTSSTALAYHNAGKTLFLIRKLDLAMDYLVHAESIYNAIGDTAKASEVDEEYKMVKAYKGYDLV